MTLQEASTRRDVGVTRLTCRACGARGLEPVLDLGTHALSGFLAPGDPEPDIAPLLLVRCGCCGLVQMGHTVPRERLYARYWYRSGTNETMVAALGDVVRSAMAMVRLSPNDRVLDIGANDGTLLAQYPDWLTRFGVEPARALADEAFHRGFLVVTDYWPLRAPLPGQFKIITSIAQFYNVDEPNPYLAEVARALCDDGVFVLQFQDLDSMLAANAFDNVCHEHLCHYDPRSLARLLAGHGLRIVRAEFNPTNGGSLRVYARKSRAPVEPGEYPQPANEHIADFVRRVRNERARLLSFLEECAANDKTVLGYAASTKGNTLLQYCEITPDLLPAIADRNPEKVGRRTAGTGIPIISEEEMRARKPDYLLALAWHFITAFQERERALLDSGTRFVVPLPSFRILSA